MYMSVSQRQQYHVTDVLSLSCCFLSVAVVCFFFCSSRTSANDKHTKKTNNKQKAKHLICCKLASVTMNVYEWGEQTVMRCGSCGKSELHENEIIKHMTQYMCRLQSCDLRNTCFCYDRRRC